MPTVDVFQNNFTSGEISPDLNARVDVKQYNNGALLMEDAIPALEGGVEGRPGSRFLFPLFGNPAVRLIDFIFSNTDTYLIVATPSRFRFANEQVLITESPITVTSAFADGFGRIQLVAPAHGLSSLDEIEVTGVGGTVEANSFFQISVVDVNNITLLGSLFVNAYTSGGQIKRTHTVTTTYTAADLPNLRWAQDGNIMYIVDGAHVPIQLTRETAVTFSTEQFIPNGPYKENDPGDTTTMTYIGGLAVGDTGIVVSSDSTFSANDVDRIIRLGPATGNPAIRGYGQIFSFNTVAQVVIRVLSPLDSSVTVASTDWALGEWGGDAGYPSEVTFHEQRLVFAATTLEPQAWWGSFLNDPTDFVRDNQTDNAESYKFTIRNEKINFIKWMTSLNTLVAGTQGEELRIQGPANTTIGPAAAPLIQSQTRRGSGDIAPLVIDDLILFMQWGDRRLFTLEFNESVNSDRLSGQDLSFISRHLIPEGTYIRQLTYEEQPNNVVWLVRSDGKLLSMVFFPEQEVLAWSLHTITDAEILDCKALPSVANGINDTYIVEQRQINGLTRTNVCVLDRNIYVDSALSGTFGTPQTIINGLQHLIGETVTTRIDDGEGPTFVVNSAGQIDLSTVGLTASSIQVGLPFEPTVIPLEPIGEQPEASFGRKKKYGSIIIRTKDMDNLVVNDREQSRRSAQDLVSSIPRYPQLTDWLIKDLGYRTIESVKISQPKPLPFFVLSITGNMTVGER